MIGRSKRESKRQKGKRKLIIGTKRYRKSWTGRWYNISLYNLPLVYVFFFLFRGTTMGNWFKLLLRYSIVFYFCLVGGIMRLCGEELKGIRHGKAKRVASPHIDCVLLFGRLGGLIKGFGIGEQGLILGWNLATVSWRNQRWVGVPRSVSVSYHLMFYCRTESCVPWLDVCLRFLYIVSYIRHTRHDARCVALSTLNVILFLFFVFFVFSFI